MFRATNSPILRSIFLTLYTAFGTMHRHCCRPVPRLCWIVSSISTVHLVGCLHRGTDVVKPIEVSEIFAKKLILFIVWFSVGLSLCSIAQWFWAWCVFVRASLHLRREENQLDVTECFIALMICSACFGHFYCPSSGARDYMCVVTAYGVQWLVAGCRGSGAGSRLCVQKEGCCT